MLETKQQKKYFVTAMVLVVILSLVSFWNRGNFQYVDKTDYTKKPAFDYDAYLASIQVDPVASKELFEQIISEEEVKKEVEKELQVDQKVEIPKVDQKKINVSNETGNDATVAYFEKQNELLQNWKNLIGKDVEGLYYNADSAELVNLTEQTLKQLYNLKVPKEAKVAHENQLVALESYQNIFKASLAYQTEPGVSPWPEVYRNHVILDKVNSIFNSEFDKLDAKYSINMQLQAKEDSYAKGNILAPSASAILGIGDIVIDIRAEWRDIYRTVLRATYVQFAKEFLDRLITKIETNYKIANFLYYTDALVTGQYVDDYINKYITKGENELDKAIIKNFIPKIACGGKQQNLTTIFDAKAQQYLGFDPSTLSPTDPDYYQKMAKTGNFLADSSGWQLYYQDVAMQAQAEAEQAAQNELLSEGLKAGRDPKTAKDIATTMASVSETMRAALYTFFGVGTVLADSTAGMIAGTAVQVFINSYLFKGVVFKEQSTCISIPQISPLLPASNVSVPTPTPPDQGQLQDDLQVQNCVESNDHSVACTSAVNRRYAQCGKVPDTLNICKDIYNYFGR